MKLGTAENEKWMAGNKRGDSTTTKESDFAKSITGIRLSSHGIFGEKEMEWSFKNYLTKINNARETM